MCQGNAGIMTQYDPDRVKKPLSGWRPGADKWQEIDYDTAVREIAEKLAEIKANDGPEKVVWFTEDNTAVRFSRASAMSSARPISCSTPPVRRGPEVRVREDAGQRPAAGGFPEHEVHADFRLNPLSATKWAPSPAHPAGRAGQRRETGPGRSPVF